jgi:hypothetical protein
MGLTEKEADRHRAATAERARFHGLCCPPAMTGGAVLLDMAREAGATAERATTLS